MHPSTKNIVSAYHQGAEDKRNKLPSRHKQYKKDAKKAYQNGYKNGI